MIQNYEIKYKNKEEILYMYLNFNTEFAQLNNKKTKTKLKKEIKKYIKKNNIDFKGTTVAIIVGGIMIGTIFLNKPKYNNTKFSNTNYTVSLLKDSINIDNKEDNNEIVEKIEDVERPKEVKDDKSETENYVTSKEDKSTNDTNIKTNIISSSKINKEESTTNIPTIKEDTINNEKEIIDNNTYVTIYRQNGDILNIELEEYLIGVVAGEIPASFNIEALKAQAIIARTYTIKSLNTGKKLTDTTSTQVYKSNNELKNTWGSNYNVYYNKIKNAVEYTKGLVLTYNSSLIEAVYHSTSNGKTEDSSNVWGNYFPYLISVDSPYDITNKSFFQTTLFTYETLSNKLNSIITIDTNFNIILNESGRVSTIEFDNKKLTGVEFRTKLGLRSTDFTLEKTTDGINITTKGYGHGVGMSQYGANGMANNGSNYETILKHYYKGISLTQR